MDAIWLTNTTYIKAVKNIIYFELQKCFNFLIQILADLQMLYLKSSLYFVYNNLYYTIKLHIYACTVGLCAQNTSNN
jgi:hypothetical protein